MGTGFGGNIPWICEKQITTDLMWQLTFHEVLGSLLFHWVLFCLDLGNIPIIPASELGSVQLPKMHEDCNMDSRPSNIRQPIHSMSIRHGQANFY